MATSFLANLLGAFVGILTLAPMYIGIIRDARESGCKELADNVKSKWVSYMGGCVLTAYYSWQFSLIISYLL